MKHLDFNKGFINESTQEPEMINEFLGTLLVCGVLAAYGSMGVLSVFKKLGGLRNELMDLRQKRLAAKNEKMKQKYELEVQKRKYMLLKSGLPTDAVEDMVKTGGTGGGDEKEEKELRGLLKKKREDLSPKELARVEELSDRVDIDKALTDKERAALTAMTGGQPQLPESTKAELDKEGKEFKSQRNKALKTIMAYENAVNQLQDGPEKDKHLKHLESLTKVMSGSGSAEDIEAVEKFSKESLTPEGQKILEQVEKSVEKISDEDVEKWKKEKGVTDEGLTKTMDTVAKENPKLLGEPKKETTQGAQGTQGGAQGADGTQGAQGTQGGAQGAQGTQDSTQGTQGAQGTPDGTQGVQGTQGAQDGEDEESDDIKDADREDQDDPDMVDDNDKNAMNDPDIDPHKKYKQRTYKRGNKTFKTKSYYSKNNTPISKEKFQEMERAYQERQEAKKNKNNKTEKTENSSFKYSPWTMTRLCEARKPAPVMEDEQGSDMETICKERLVYIKFVMDTTTNSVEKVKMERMYNAIFNCCFDSNGKARSMDDLYTYLNDTMIENKGEVPGLPTNDQVVNIDDKCKAWKKLSPDKFDAYMARLNKELLDKAGTKKTDKAKDLLSPDNNDSNTANTEAISKIRGLSTKYGFTNILGLEPTRQASKEDDEKKDEINKQEKDGSPKADATDSKDVKADDVSPEQVDKIVGVSK